MSANAILPKPQVKISAANVCTRKVIDKRLDELAGAIALPIGFDERQRAEREQAYLQDLIKRKYS